MTLPARDDDLVERATNGDHGAFTTLLRRHDDRLRAVAFRLLGDRDRMDDAMQDAYVNAYRRLPSFRGDTDFGGWLYRIVYNACIDELRSGRRHAGPVDVAEARWDRPATEPGPERTVAASDAVTRALAALPDDQRVTVVLVDGEGFDHETAARILGVATGTVASRLSRARATIRAAIGEENR